MYEFEYW